MKSRNAQECKGTHKRRNTAKELNSRAISWIPSETKAGKLLAA